MAKFLCYILGHNYGPYQTNKIDIQWRDCQRCDHGEVYHHDPLAIMLGDG